MSHCMSSFILHQIKKILSKELSFRKFAIVKLGDILRAIPKNDQI